MSDDPVRTEIRSRGEWIGFQDYFVRQRCEPVAEALRFRGAQEARVHPDVMQALRNPDLKAVVICPSNPFLSIDPILAMPGMRDALHASRAPVIAVSPIIDGQSVKGPTAKLMKEFGLEASAPAVAAHYGELVDIFVADEKDARASFSRGTEVVFREILMTTLDIREALAREVIALADASRCRRT
jgi:LPPG:FO 2-phospho-L-lactate transferase